ncbi:hypothetical protein [Devosia sp.]|uniref:hypothetical protein n=1 Tax=Devosia sp. TaxID=1871048 RepID=UPI003263BBFD
MIGIDMHRHIAWIVLSATLALTMPSIAEDVRLELGGDLYLAGRNPTVATAITHDAFVAGNDVSLQAPITGDAHLAGFHVSAAAPVSGDLYAAGYGVTATAPIGGDMTAAGNTITLSSTSSIAANLRLAGATILLSAPVSGSALISAQTLTLDTTIAGDFSFYGEAIVFGPGAKVGGVLTIRAPKPIDVPVSVASADRVKFQLADAPNYVNEAGKTADGVVKSFWPAIWAMGIWLLVLFVVGAALIVWAPKAVARAQSNSSLRPFKTFGYGILVFSSVLGLTIVAAMTVIGLLAVPIVLIFVFLACSLAYLAGCYLLTLRIFGRFLAVNTNARRFGVLATAIVLAALIGIVPLLGWLFTLGLVCFGFGATKNVGPVGTPDAAGLYEAHSHV